MAVFPKLENDITALAEGMVAGFILHPDDFPGVDVAALQGILAEYKQARYQQEQLQGQALRATHIKKEKLRQLKRRMRNDLNIAEAHNSAKPDNLTFIGWSVKRPRRPVEPPAMPTDLRIISDSSLPADEITLSWTCPQSGGPVRNYIIKRRTLNLPGQDTGWQLIDFYYDNLITLKNQPRGVQLEYTVTACNYSGSSVPSNALRVVL